jgi:hypothetical protein
MRVPWPLLTLLLFAPTALALDGAFEVNQTCALAGCFPGDAPGFPVSLPDPGHYVLTSDLATSPWSS